MILTADIPKLRLFPPGWRHRPTPARGRSPGVFPKSRFSPPPGQPRTPAPRRPHRGSFPCSSSRRSPTARPMQQARISVKILYSALRLCPVNFCTLLLWKHMHAAECPTSQELSSMHQATPMGARNFPVHIGGASIYLVCCSHSCPIVLTQIFHFSIPACSIRPLQWNEFFVHANPHIKQIGPCSRESLFRFAPPKPGRSGEFRRSIPVEQGGHPHADRAFPVNPGSPRAAGRLTRAQISAH